MVTASFRSALGLLKAPAAWLPGIALGAMAATFLLMQYYLGLFLAERVLFVLLVLLPFFMAGLLWMVKTGDTGIRRYLSEAAAGYFRVLLPTIVVLFALLITISLLLFPLMILGIGMQGLVFAMFTGTFSVLFFTIFYDAAAIIEGKTVFESVRRSVEFVIQHTHSCIVFYLTSLVVGGIIWFGTLLAWSAVLYDRLLPVTTLTMEEMQSFTPDQFNAMLGLDGIIVSALIFFAGIAVTFSILYPFKASFYRDYAGKGPQEQVLQGEYDSKGRWYKY